VTLLISVMEPPGRPVTKASFKPFNVCSSMVKDGEVNVVSPEEIDFVSRMIDKMFPAISKVRQSYTWRKYSFHVMSPCLYGTLGRGI
jgi:hypothetical protein